MCVQGSGDCGSGWSVVTAVLRWSVSRSGRPGEYLRIGVSPCEFPDPGSRYRTKGVQRRPKAPCLRSRVRLSVCIVFLSPIKLIRSASLRLLLPFFRADTPGTPRPRETAELSTYFCRGWNGVGRGGGVLNFTSHSPYFYCPL